MNHHATMSHAHDGAISPVDARQLAKDPICGMMVDKATALTTERGGRTYYFCSASCKRTFENPERGDAKAQERPDARATPPKVVAFRKPRRGILVFAMVQLP
jgi:YHS domain-containing protein